MRNEGGWKRAGQRRYSQHKTEPRGMQRRFVRSNTRSGSTVGIMDFVNRFAGVSTATRPAAKLFDFSSLSPAVQQHLQQVRGAGAAREGRESWLRAAGGGRKAPGRSLSSNCLFVEGLADGSAPEAYCTSLHPQVARKLARRPGMHAAACPLPSYHNRLARVPPLCTAHRSSNKLEVTNLEPPRSTALPPCRSM